MRVDDNISKCVVFVGMQIPDGSHRFAGSAFWLADDRIPESPVYLVTARHVIDGIRDLGLTEVWLRINQVDGTCKWVRSELAEWEIHPTDPSIDVAILKAALPAGSDHLVFPHSKCITQALMTDNEVGVGDEVFVVGLFVHHHGDRKNIPIIRVGNLASLGEERVVTEEFGPIEASLIEARSIGGLSGSPVFLNLGVARLFGGQFQSASGPMHFLYGLIHGHFDVSTSAIDLTSLDEGAQGTKDKVNTGIAIVVPFHSIDAVINNHARR